MEQRRVEEQKPKSELAARSAEAGPLDVGEVFAGAVRAFSKHYDVLALSYLLYGLAIALPLVPIYFAPADKLHYPLFAFALTFGALASTYLRAGLTRIWVRAARGEPVRFGDLFRGGARVWPLFGTELVTNLPAIVGVGILATSYARAGAFSLLPAILFAVLALVSASLGFLGFSFAPFYAVDAKGGVWKSIRNAWRACSRERAKLFVVGALALVMMQAGAIACGLGLLVVGPIMHVAAASIYTRLSGRGASEDNNEGFGFQGYAMPAALWICGAFYVHFLLFAGGDAIGRAYEDRARLELLLEKAIARTSMIEAPTLEVSLNDAPALEEKQDKPDETEPKDKVKDEKKPELAKPEPKKLEKPKPEEKKLALKKAEEKKTPPANIEPIQDNRIAVKQHAKKDQEPNPTAKFIADDANHVDNESVATQTSHDQDDPNPTPGGNHAGPQDQPGDSEQTKIAESEEHKGEKNRAPGEKGDQVDPKSEPMPKNPSPVPVQAPPKPAAVAQEPKPAPTPPQVTTPQPAPGGAQASPEVQQGTSGWTFNWVKPGETPAAPGTAGSSAGNPAPQGAMMSPLFGLNKGPAAPGQMNLNMTQNVVLAVVGQDNLRKMRYADGERRKSEHRGSWQASNFERWRNAIENYVSTVKPGNQTALNTAAVPFASYLNAMHNRIHPIFADSFLASLDSLPKDHPLNDMTRVTRLEIVLTRDGRLRKMGIVKSSGSTNFDIAALDSVDRAQPFGPAPSAIVSPDGNVYLHWEFHRDEVYACSTMHARPFILKAAPQTPEPEVPPAPATPPGPSRERTGPPPVNTPELQQGSVPSASRTSARG